MPGKIIRDIKPSPINNRNSEGAFITLKNGDILFAYSSYGSDGHEDDSRADIYATVSHDNGESFGESYLVLDHTLLPKTTNFMSVSFMRMQNGDVGLLFLAKIGNEFCMPYLTRSSDEGKSWSYPTLCCDMEGYFVVNNDRMIRTKCGRILIPAALHVPIIVNDQNGNKALRGYEPGILYVYASDDDGYSWYLLSKGLQLPVSGGCKTGLQEPGLLELEDGRLWCYIRNDTGRQYESFSSDGGVTWSTPLPSCFTSAVSPLSTKYLSDGRILAVWNPIPLYNGRSQFRNGVWTGARTPLVLATSTDGAKTFSEPMAIETDEDRGFCYVAIHEVSDFVLLAYCAGGCEDKGALNRLRIRKIKLSEI